MRLEIELDVPANVIDKSFEDELRSEAILLLFSDRKISSAHAARLLGLKRIEFMELLIKRKIPQVDYTDQDWRADGRAVEQLELEQRP
ncbi:MAG: UPF0175 family protein [Bryobacteraceae bacterium]